MNTPEEYENLISVMKKALEFYADQRNYDGPMGNAALIDLDEHGSQARLLLVEKTRRTCMCVNVKLVLCFNTMRCFGI